MWGSIIGDLAGSIYEFNQTKKVVKLNPTKLINNDSFYSDDTILTIAILDAILNDKNYDSFLKNYAKKYMDYKPDYKPYFKGTFSTNFTKWVNSNEIGKSNGNGAMMRISPVGYLFDKEEDILNNVLLATKPSHNTKESIDNATIIALIIFYARKRYTKEQIIKQLNLNIKYKDFTKFNSTCYETIDNCLYALFTTNSFEEAILKVISYGGDTDTNACIVGSMAEALYGIDKNLIQMSKEKIPDEFVNILEKGYSLVKKL